MHGNGRESARPLVSVLVALFTGAGIALQQLSTGEPASFGRWAMLVVGSAIGGLGGLLAAGLFEPLLRWSGGALAKLRQVLQPRSQQILFERGGFAATREIVYRDAEVRTRYRYAPTLLEAIRDARARPVTPHYAQFSATFRAVVRQALADGGRLPPDAKSRLEGALQGYKR